MNAYELPLIDSFEITFQLFWSLISVPPPQTTAGPRFDIWGQHVELSEKMEEHGHEEHTLSAAPTHPTQANHSYLYRTL